MRIPRSIVIGSALLLSAAVIPTADAALLDRVGIYASYWQATLEGNGRIDGTTQGEFYDLTSVAGLDDEDGIKEIGAWFHPIGRHRFRVSALDASFDGGRTLTTTLLAGDVLLPASTVVGSSADMKLYKAHYNYSFVNLDLVNVGGLVGVDYADAENRLVALGTDHVASLKGGVPVVGLNAQVSPVGFFRAYGEATYANWKVGDLDASIRDVAVRVEFYVAHFFGLGAGYRNLKLELEDEDEGRIDTRTDGYQLFLLFRF